MDVVPGSGHAPSCVVPGTFDPDRRRELSADVRRLIRAAEWLFAEIDDGRGCHAAIQQVSVLQAELDTIAGRLIESHLRYCLTRALEAGGTPQEIQSLVSPLTSLLHLRRSR